jgi:hypothetical protein
MEEDHGRNGYMSVPMTQRTQFSVVSTEVTSNKNSEVKNKLSQLSAGTFNKNSETESPFKKQSDLKDPQIHIRQFSTVHQLSQEEIHQTII